MRALERQEGETQKAWQGFVTFRDLGPQRTLKAVAQILYGVRSKHGLRTVENWSSKNEWISRAQAWDDLLQMERLDALREAERDKAHDLAMRNQLLDEQILSLKEQLIPKLKQMLDFPLVRMKHESRNGKEITHIYPARWSFNTVIRAIELLDTTPERIDLTSGGHPFDFTFVLDRPEHDQNSREERNS